LIFLKVAGPEFVAGWRLLLCKYSLKEVVWSRQSEIRTGAHRIGGMKSIFFRLRTFLSKMKRKLSDDFKVTFSQCGEDVIIDHIFTVLKKNRITYLDIGAHSPTYLSNTHYFYLKGSRGVCVEADPSLIPAFKRQRPDDVCLNVGVGREEGEGDFYVMSAPTLNTFSKEEAERYQSYGQHRIQRVSKIALRTVNHIIEEQFKVAPDFVSLDVEGMDLDILRSFDFSVFRPTVFCIETLTYVEDKSERKITEIIEYMQQQGYFVYADTYINSIFVDVNIWKNRA